MTMMDGNGVTNRTTSKSSKKRWGSSVGKSAGKSIGMLGKDDAATVVDCIDQASQPSSTAPSAAADNKATSAPTAESTNNNGDPTATASSSGGGIIVIVLFRGLNAASSPKSYGTTEETMGVAQTNRKGSATDNVEVAADLVAASESVATFNSVLSVVATTSSSNNNDCNNGDAFRDEETTTADAQEVGDVESSKDDNATIVGNGGGIRDNCGHEHRRYHHRNLPTGQQQRLSDAESSSGRSSVQPKQIGHANKRRAPTLG